MTSLIPSAIGWIAPQLSLNKDVSDIKYPTKVDMLFKTKKPLNRNYLVLIVEDELFVVKCANQKSWIKKTYDS